MQCSNKLDCSFRYVLLFCYCCFCCDSLFIYFAECRSLVSFCCCCLASSIEELAEQTHSCLQISLFLLLSLLQLLLLFYYCFESEKMLNAPFSFIFLLSTSFSFFCIDNCQTTFTFYEMIPFHFWQRTGPRGISRKSLYIQQKPAINSSYATSCSLSHSLSRLTLALAMAQSGLVAQASQSSYRYVRRFYTHVQMYVCLFVLENVLQVRKRDNNKRTHCVLYNYFSQILPLLTGLHSHWQRSR